MIAPSPQRKLCMSEKNKNTNRTGSPFNFTSLLKSSVVSVPSNGTTKKKGRKKKRTQKLPNICKFRV